MLLVEDYKCHRPQSSPSCSINSYCSPRFQWILRPSSIPVSSYSKINLSSTAYSWRKIFEEWKKKKITNPRENLRKSIYFPINVSSIRCLYFVSNNKSNESWINRRTLNQIERIWIKLGVDRRRGWSLRASNDNTILTKRNPSSAWIWLSIEPPQKCHPAFNQIESIHAIRSSKSLVELQHPNDPKSSLLAFWLWILICIYAFNLRVTIE